MRAQMAFDLRYVQAEAYVATVASTTVISSGLPPDKCFIFQIVKEKKKKKQIF